MDRHINIARRKSNRKDTPDRHIDTAVRIDKTDVLLPIWCVLLGCQGQAHKFGDSCPSGLEGGGQSKSGKGNIAEWQTSSKAGAAFQVSYRETGAETRV